MEVAERLVAVRALLERALHASEGERAWLLALAWGELAEGAAALGVALHGADDSDADRLCGPVRWHPESPPDAR